MLKREVELRKPRYTGHHAEEADQAAEALVREQEKLIHRAETRNDALVQELERLQAENRGLKADLDDARSHIFSLQPYRKDLTPDEVGREYDDLVNGITDWVTRFAEPVLEHPKKMEEVLAAAKKRSPEIHILRKWLQTHVDLMHGSLFPETDIDIIIAIIMRYLEVHIFRKILCGVVPGFVEVLSSVETSMQNNVEPKRDLFAMRTWRAEALNAVICSPEYQKGRADWIRELTLNLASTFKIFSKDIQKFCVIWQDTVIKPAVALHEKMATSTHHFYTDLNTYMMWNPHHELAQNPNFLDDLHKLRCENILQHRKTFNIAKLSPKPTREQLSAKLTNVMAVVPALYMRQVGRSDIIKEPRLIRPQQMLVAWGGQEAREKFVANKERTLMNGVLYPKEKDRAHEGGWLGWS
ncbi:hypothetical protein B0T26DRAFT_654715 [Lasiosphaeria miniovina]|uniref:Uncharacterized protein n=1 Tax=Lasiosphaeria miniovina TaxID=1954250 RepID=A0AA40DN84_9PEZI|nr:uncharacterized protein B0T26DRAFT_654715 [Lasiosphaeria miniovina]KAK0706053.1 hypothetical protein B0T26DRAFT_654715 [Lasiosphaeria miniovina]